MLATHGRLFGDIYPWAGQDREATAPQLAVGKGGRYDLFAHPRDARRAVEYALNMAAEPAQMRAKPGEVMGLLAYGHPVLDGNGRTFMTVHAELCRRAGVSIAWQDVGKRDYLDALTRELERPGQALDSVLAPHIRSGAATVAQDAARLRALPGLGPAEEPVSPAKLRRSAVGSILNALRAPEPAIPAPWEPAPVPMAERVRSLEGQAARAKDAPGKGQGPTEEPEQDAPRPRPGPRP